MKRGISQNSFFLTTVFDNTDDSVIVADENRIITYMNPIAMELFGEPLFLIIGKSPFTRIKLKQKTSTKSFSTLLKSCTSETNYTSTESVEIDCPKPTSFFLQVKIVKDVKSKKIKCHTSICFCCHIGCWLLQWQASQQWGFAHVVLVVTWRNRGWRFV